MNQELAAQILSFVPLWLIGCTWGIGAFFVAPKLGRRRWVWVPLFFIPVIGFFVAPVFFFLIIAAVLDRLNLLVQAQKT